MASAALNTNGGFEEPEFEGKQRLRRVHIEEYCRRWSTTLFSSLVSFERFANPATTVSGPVGNASIDVAEGLIYVPRGGSGILVLHELGHLLLTRYLGPPKQHNEDGALLSFEYFSMLYLEWPLEAWKNWRSATGAADERDWCEKKAQSRSNVNALLKTGLFDRRSYSRLEPTFQPFQPHPRVKRLLRELEDWTD